MTRRQVRRRHVGKRGGRQIAIRDVEAGICLAQPLDHGGGHLPADGVVAEDA